MNKIYFFILYYVNPLSLAGKGIFLSQKSSKLRYFIHDNLLLYTLKVMAQLTVLNPDDSIADIFSIPDALAIELTTVLQYSKRKSLDLALLREIELRVLSIFFKILKENNIQISNLQEFEVLAVSNINSFSSLLDVIYRIEQLPNADSLSIRLSK